MKGSLTAKSVLCKGTQVVIIESPVCDIYLDGKSARKLGERLLELTDVGLDTVTRQLLKIVEIEGRQLDLIKRHFEAGRVSELEVGVYEMRLADAKYRLALRLEKKLNAKS